MNVLWKNLNKTQLKTIEFYCNNNLSELRKIVDPMLITKKIPSLNWEDVYDIAVDVLYDSLMRYDKSKSTFKTFLIGNIRKKLSTYMRDSTRSCRCNVARDRNGNIVLDEMRNNVVIQDISIFENISGEKYCLKDTIPSDFDVEMDYFCKNYSIFSDEKVISFYEKLSKNEKELAILLAKGYSKKEVLDELHITPEDYADRMSGMKSYEKISLLF